MRTLTQTSRLHIASLNAPNALGEGSRVIKRRPTHLMLSTAEGIHLLPVDKIIRAEAASNYCTVHTDDIRKVMVSRTLKAIEEFLPCTEFVRIHQSHVVRFSEITLIRKEDLVLSDGLILPVSRQQRPVLLDRMRAFATRI